MKIGIITEIINYHSGSRAPLEIAKYLARLGQKVTVYAYSLMLDTYAKKDLENNGVTIKTFDKPNIPFIGKYLASFHLITTLRKDKPDVLSFSGTLPFFLAAKFTAIPVVRTFYGTQFDAYLENNLPNQKLGIINRFLNKLANTYIYLADFLALYLSDRIVSISNFSGTQAKHLYKKAKISTIYLGTTPLAKSNNSKNGNSRKVKIISVSRLTPYKGFHLIINALKKIATEKKIVLTIVGSQPKKKYLTYLKRKGANLVEIVIDPTDKELAKLYQKSDIYACADKNLYFGLPICEAAYFKIPAVSLNLAAAQEIVSHKKTGFIAQDQEEFAKYLEILINNSNIRRKMGIAAQKRAESYFTWEKCAQEYLELFKKIV